MGKRIISSIILLCMLNIIAFGSENQLLDEYYGNVVPKFSDITAELEWAIEPINYLVENKVINGYSDGTFKPLGSITREEFLKILLSAFGIVNMDAECDFSDVDKNQWYYMYVATADELGISNGVSKTKFGIGEYITREQMVTLSYNVAEIMNIDFNEKMTEEFSDLNAFSSWSKNPAMKLKNKGIINGNANGQFKPQEIANRAQSCKIIYFLLKNT